jgi:hypothetical protein
MESRLHVKRADFLFLLELIITRMRMTAQIVFGLRLAPGAQRLVDFTLIPYDKSTSNRYALRVSYIAFQRTVDTQLPVKTRLALLTISGKTLAD